MSTLSQRKYDWKRWLYHVPLAAADAWQNYKWRHDGPKILVVRHGGKHPYMQHYYLDWLAQAFPHVRSCFELRLLPCHIRDWSRYRLYVPWFQDPTSDWMTPATYARALTLGSECAAHGIPVINSVTQTANCIRTVAADRLNAAGIRTPRVVPITDPAQFRRDHGGLSFPFIVRDDCGHGKSVFRVTRQSELDAIRFDRMQRPIAVEWVNVVGDDGLFRKCRFVVAGELGVRRHLIVSRHWEVRANRRMANALARQEELDFLNASAPESATLDRARRCLGLDWAGFDYSFDPRGEMVVWETNPYANMSFPSDPNFRYAHPYVARSLAALTVMYLTAAGLSVPEDVLECLASPADVPVTHRDTLAVRSVA